MKKKIMSVLLAAGLCLSAAIPALACDKSNGVVYDCFSCDCSDSTQHRHHKYESRVTFISVKNNFCIVETKCTECGHKGGRKSKPIY